MAGFPPLLHRSKDIRTVTERWSRLIAEAVYRGGHLLLTGPYRSNQMRISFRYLTLAVLHIYFVIWRIDGDEIMKKILNITKALADENRLRALMMLRDGEMCVCHIIEMLGLAPSTVSKHMSLLKQADLVETRRDGKWTHYRLTDVSAGSAEGDILTWLCRQLENDPKIGKDAERIKEMRRKKIIAGTPGATVGCCNNRSNHDK